MSRDERSGSRKGTDRGLFERPKGSGVWWVRYADENGREHREKIGPKGLARKVYEKRKNEVQERRFFPERIGKREVLLAETIDDYLARIKGRLRVYPDYCRYGRYWKEAYPGRTLRQILPGDVERYMSRRSEEVAPASVNRELQFLRHLYYVAMADGKTDSNPVRTVKLYKENNKRTRFLATEEEGKLHEAMREADWPLVAFAIHTGLRQAEQFGLRWENVDFTTGLLTVPRSKNGETRRVPMNDTVREILRALPSRFKTSYVFPSQTLETPRDAANFLNRAFLPALKKAKIEGLRWHDLRHTFASRLVMAGVDLRTVQELLGHKTMEMTLRYSHLSPGHQLEAIKRLDARATGTTTAPKREALQAHREPSTQVVGFPSERWRARPDSNRRPTGSKPGALSS